VSSRSRKRRQSSPAPDTRQSKRQSAPRRTMTRSVTRSTAAAASQSLSSLSSQPAFVPPLIAIHDDASSSLAATQLDAPASSQLSSLRAAFDPFESSASSSSQIAPERSTSQVTVSADFEEIIDEPLRDVSPLRSFSRSPEPREFSLEIRRRSSVRTRVVDVTLSPSPSPPSAVRASSSSSAAESGWYWRLSSVKVVFLAVVIVPAVNESREICRR